MDLGRFPFRGSRWPYRHPALERVRQTGGCLDDLCATNTAVSEIYDPTSNTWSTTGSLSTARSFHTAVALKTGKVLAIGGSTATGSTTSCELYDSTKGTWSSAASTTTARYLNASTLLSDGKVLATGSDASRYPVNSAELYDPTANTWTLTGNMTTGRYAYTASLLTDGTVLVAGGIGTAISCGKDAQCSYILTSKVDIYNETTGTSTAAASSEPIIGVSIYDNPVFGTGARGWRHCDYQHLLYGAEYGVDLYSSAVDLLPAA